MKEICSVLVSFFTSLPIRAPCDKSDASSLFCQVLSDIFPEKDLLSALKYLLQYLLYLVALSVQSAFAFALFEQIQVIFSSALLPFMLLLQQKLKRVCTSCFLSHSRELCLTYVHLKEFVFL